MHFSPLKGLKRNKEGGGVRGSRGNLQKKWSQRLAFTDESCGCSCYKHYSFPFLTSPRLLLSFQAFSRSKQKVIKDFWLTCSFAVMIRWQEERRGKKKTKPLLIKCHKEKTKTYVLCTVSSETLSCMFWISNTAHILKDSSWSVYW